MCNVEGGSEKTEHSRSVSLAAGVYCSTPRSRARNQYNQTSSSRVLRIRAARSWVNRPRVLASIRSSCDLHPHRIERDSARRSHRCSWISPPTSLARQVGGRRDCVNLVRRSHELDLHFLHQHATEEEGFGGSCSVRIDLTATGASRWWGGGWWKNRHRRGSSRCCQVQGQGCTNLGDRTCTAPISGGTRPTALWYS